MSEKKAANQSKVARELERAAVRKAKLREKNQAKEAKAAAKPNKNVQPKNNIPQARSKGIQKSAGTALRNTSKPGMRGA